MVVTFENVPQKVFEIFQQNEEILEHLRRLNPPQQTDQWFDLNELCNYLPDKPATATVYGWVHTAQIPCHKGNKRLRFLKSEIDFWLLQGRKKTLQQTALEADAYLLKSKGGAGRNYGK
jgi:Helix-turn-helix domain